MTTTPFSKYNGTNHQHASVSRVYGGDTSGTKTYSFNSLGFRGDEPTDGTSLYVCGCSCTFGTGLNWDETWAYQFNQQFEAANLLNFSQGGASNQYIARTLITQCEAHKPTLVIAHFTHSDRTEYLLREGDHPSAHTANVGKWTHKLKPPREFKALFNRILTFANNHYRDYCEYDGYYNALLNMFALQSYCRSKGIPLITLWADYKNPFNNLAMQQIRDMIAITPLSIYDFKLDKAADNLHPGAESNKEFAKTLWGGYSHFKAREPQ